jgi:hypothetical protein
MHLQVAATNDVPPSSRDQDLRSAFQRYARFVHHDDLKKAGEAWRNQTVEFYLAGELDLIRPMREWAEAEIAALTKPVDTIH